MEEWTKGGLAQELSGRQSAEFELHSFIVQLYEKGIQAGNLLVRTQDNHQACQTAECQTLKTGDLVFVHDFQQAKHKGAKVETRWSTHRIVDKISASGASAHIRQLHDLPGITKHFHLNGLIVYVLRSQDFPSRTTVVGELASSAVEYIRDTMGEIG